MAYGNYGLRDVTADGPRVLVTTKTKGTSPKILLKQSMSGLKKKPTR